LKGAVTGFTILQAFRQSIVRLRRIAVSTPSSGTGTQLLRSAVDWVFNHAHVAAIDLQVKHHNQRAKTVYLREGFAFEGEGEGDDHERMVMFREVWSALARRAVMSPVLSVLDLSPVGGDDTQAQAVRETIEVAKAAERLGYNRFWVAEHHNIGTLGSAAPEILIAALTQVTKTIRLGSGGVMLVNYSPLKVAEVFMELEALAPGRIDLGVGRALGTDSRTGGSPRSVSSEAFPQYFALLNAWLLDASG